MKKLLFAMVALLLSAPVWADGLVMRGDVNDDGSVDPADISMLIDRLLNGAAVNEFAADADMDGVLSPSDISVLIDYLLNGRWISEGEIFAVGGVSFRMIPVEGGMFTMGATGEQGSQANANEKPAHNVAVSNFTIGQTEVTQELWQAVMGSNPSLATGDMKRPVEYVTWNDCQVFIEKLNQLTGQEFRLPTEAEWEFAARGGNKSSHCKCAGSDEIDDVAWYSSNSGSKPHPVATKAANELGVYDMSGNVAEWCQDWYSSYSDSLQFDPAGPATGSTRVLRGGGWQNGAAWCRVSQRDGLRGPAYRDSNVGLRLALDSYVPATAAPVITTSLQDDYLTITATGDGAVCLYVDGVLVRNPHTVSRGTAAYTVTVYATAQEEGKSMRWSREMTCTVLPLGVTAREFVVGGVRFTMLGIGGGSFMMGASQEQGSAAQSNEKPAHQVTLTGYAIGQTEVTQELWEAVMGANPCYWQGDARRPAENVSWNDCQVFIARLNALTGMNFRLPTEAEWEFAARGGSLSLGYKYAGSNTLDEVAWYSGNGGGAPHHVGAKAPNELGLFDMSGNVWEYCQDYYDSYTADAQTNPTGPASGSKRVLHGGAYPNSAADCRVAVRHSESMTFKAKDVGLRIAL